MSGTFAQLQECKTALEELEKKERLTEERYRAAISRVSKLRTRVADLEFELHKRHFELEGAQQKLATLGTWFLLLAGGSAVSDPDAAKLPWKEGLIWYIDNIMTPEERAEFRYDPRKED